MLRFAPNVGIRFLTDQLGTILQAACLWSAEHGVDVLVTSIDEEAPAIRRYGLHGSSLAADMDPSSPAPTARQSLADFCTRTLPGEFHVVLQSDQLHVEWSPRAPAPADTPD